MHTVHADCSYLLASSFLLDSLTIVPFVLGRTKFSQGGLGGHRSGAVDWSLMGSAGTPEDSDSPSPKTVDEQEWMGKAQEPASHL